MLPYSKQETDYYCGPAVVQMALARIGIVFTQKQLAKELATSPEVGTSADAIVALLRHHGLKPERRNGASLDDIRAALAEGKAAIVGYIDKDNDPHYALASIVTDDTITLADPAWGEAYTMPLQEFESRWRDDEAAMYGERLLIVID